MFYSAVVGRMPVPRTILVCLNAEKIEKEKKFSYKEIGEEKINIKSEILVVCIKQSKSEEKKKL